MAKKVSFAQKMMKTEIPTCPVCGEKYLFLKKVTTYKSEKTGSYKYLTQNLKVCKCNEKEAWS